MNNFIHDQTPPKILGISRDPSHRFHPATSTMVMFVQRGTGGTVGMFTTSETCGFARYLRLAGLNSEDLSNALNHDIS